MPLNRLLGIDLPRGIQEQPKECRYWLRPAFRALLDSGDLAHLELLE